MKRMKWWIAGLCAAGFIALALLLPQMSRVDSAVFDVLYRLRTPATHAIALIITNFAGPIALLALSLALVLVMRQKAYRIPLLLNLMLSLLLNLSLKAIFARVRPGQDTALIVESGYSFPSAHAMVAVAFYGFLIFLVWRATQPKRRRHLAAALLASLALLICLSRVFLGVHYFSDVLGGALISIAYLIVFTSLVQRYQQEEVVFVPENRQKNAGLWQSFRHAFDGVAGGLRSERNMVIHFAAMTTVVVFGLLLGISATEWLVCVVLFGLMFMAELINTAIETVVDICQPEVDPRAKLAKDTAAGAVLVCAIAAAIAGAIIFLPKLYAVFLLA